MNNTNYLGWNTSGHLETFDFWNGMPKAEFLFKYGGFQSLIQNSEAVFS